MCLAQVHNTVTTMVIEPRTSRFVLINLINGGVDILAEVSRIFLES